MLSFAALGSRRLDFWFDLLRDVRWLPKTSEINGSRGVVDSKKAQIASPQNIFGNPQETSPFHGKTSLY